MISFHYTGGMGNQMFQYALLYAVSKKTGYEIGGRWKLGERYFGLYVKDPGRPLVREYKEADERTQAYDPTVFTQPDDTKYRGYFQNEKFFSDLREEIQSIFTPRKEIQKKVDVFVQRHLSPEKMTIACCLRAGTYFSFGFPVPGEQYYRDALDFICQADKKQLSDYNVLIISDDKCVARKIFKFLPHAIMGEVKDDVQLFLIVEADRCIIGPSSFFWWGAWLNERPDKMIIAPRYWLNCNKDEPPWLPSGIQIDNWHYIRVPRCVQAGDLGFSVLLWTYIHSLRINAREMARFMRRDLQRHFRSTGNVLL